MQNKLKPSLVFSSLILLTLYLFWTHQWFTRPQIELGDWNTYFRGLYELMAGGMGHEQITFANLGFSLFIWVSSFITGLDVITGTYTVIYFLWLISLGLSWKILAQFSSKTWANCVFSVFFIYFINTEFCTYTVLSESVFTPTLLLIFALLYRWQPKQQPLGLLLIGLLLGFAQSIRPLVFLGIFVPLTITLLAQLITRQRTQPLKNLLCLVLGFFLINFGFDSLTTHIYGQKIPQSSMKSLTYSLLSLHGIALRDNGPATRELLDYDLALSYPRKQVHREGSLFNDDSPFDASLELYGLAGSAELYQRAARETIREHYPLIIRNILINLGAFLVGYDFLDVDSRRQADGLVFRQNPEAWQNPAALFQSVVIGMTHFPPLLLIPFFLLIIPHYARKIPMIMWIYLFFAAISIGVPSVSVRYVFRYAWPIHVLLFFQLGIYFRHYRLSRKQTLA